MTQDDKPLLTLKAAPSRRIAATAMLGLLSLMVGLLAVRVFSHSMLAGIALFTLAALCAVAARWYWWSSGAEITLSEQALRTSRGVTLAPVDTMTLVDRGVFAFRPSSGMLIRLQKPAPFAYAPGLYWRFGRSLGIGGAIRRGDNKIMADLLSAMILEREKERS